MKRDLNKHEAMFFNWKEDVAKCSISGISKINSKLIIDYILDMEIGRNIARGSKKGARSYGRLNVVRLKLLQIIKMFEKRGVKDITKLTEKKAHLLFDDIYKGKIKRIDGKIYESPIDFVRTFKGFWHWWIKVNRKKGKLILDICEDLEITESEVKFVYITKEQLDKMLTYFTYDEQVLCKFLFDSIIRFPTECLSLQVKDIYERDGDVWVNIPDDVSKTFGRNFNLVYCGDALIKYIKDKELEADDYLFCFMKNVNYVNSFNKKLKQIAVQVLGDVVSHPKAQKKFSEISGYDFRHSGAIHLRVLASKNNSISLDAIRQRGGWKDFDMLNYYTKFIGLSGEIKKESLLVQDDRTRLEKELDVVKKKIKILEPLAQYLYLKKHTKQELGKIREKAYQIQKDNEEELLIEGKLIKNAVK